MFLVFGSQGSTQKWENNKESYAFTQWTVNWADSKFQAPYPNLNKKDTGPI